MADFTLDPDVVLGLLGGGGSGGSSGETFGPMQYDPSIGKYVQIGSRGTVRVVGSPAQTAPTGNPRESYPGSGVTHEGVSIYAIPTSQSPTGFMLADGTIILPNGAPAGGNVFANTARGDGVTYTKADGTKAIFYPDSGEVIDFPGTGGGTAQPATYSDGGGGSSGASAYSSIATAQIDAASRLAAIEAETAARAQAAQQEADLQKQLILLNQNFTAEQNRISNALAAAGQASQIAVANAQLKQQYEAQKVALIGQYRESLKDYDARAVWDAIRGTGALQNAVGQGQSLLTDNANAGAAALLGALERPFDPIPAYDPNLFGSGIGGPMTGGLPGGGATGGVTGGTGGTGATNGAGATGLVGGLGGGVDLVQIERDMLAQGIPPAEVEAMMRELAIGQGEVNEAQLSHYYRQMTGNGQFLQRGADGSRSIGGTGSDGAHELQGNYSGVWQTVDPYAPNYKSPNDPMFQPGYTQPTSVSGMAGAGGNFVPPTEPIPTNHPLAGGLTGGVVKPPDTVIPMLAGGGMAKGAFITGDSLSGRPTGHEELVIAPGGAHVIPLGKMGAQQLMGQLPRFAYGTLSGGTLTRTRSTYQEPTSSPFTAPVPPPTIPYSEPVQNPIPQPAPVPTQPTPVTGTTGGSGTTPSPTTTPLPVPSTPPAAAQPPVTPTNPLDSVYTPEQQDLLDRVMEYRTGTADMMLPFGPWDVAFQGLTPFEQNLYYQNEAQKRGIPAELFAQDVARRGLAGVSGGMSGKIGY